MVVSGVVLYQMLVVFVPFWGDSPMEIFEAMLRANLRFPTRVFCSISPAAKDLLRRMLCKELSRKFSGTHGLALLNKVSDLMCVEVIDFSVYTTAPYYAFWGQRMKKVPPFFPWLEDSAEYKSHANFVSFRVPTLVFLVVG
ncbi:Phosphoenolpyruvate carboxylase kinase 1 [Glycine soja]